jgi:hypothetical protein
MTATHQLRPQHYRTAYKIPTACRPNISPFRPCIQLVATCNQRLPSLILPVQAMSDAHIGTIK